MVRQYSTDSFRRIPFRHLVICLGILLAALHIESDLNARPIKYLGIGNSFTWNSTHYLDEIAASEGLPLDFYVAGISGASMQNHLDRHHLHQRDPNHPDGRPYRARNARHDPEGDDHPYSLKEILQKERWDIISIQQLSRLSFLPESYEPSAGELIGLIRKHAPQAEIVVLMTWAYREDHSWFRDGTLKSQAEMFERLRDAYEQLAEQYDLRTSPVGHAINLARQMDNWRFAFPDPKFNYTIPSPPALPDQSGSLNVGWYWRTNKETEENTLHLDATHLNDAGKYLGSLTQFEFLMGRSASDESFSPRHLTQDEVSSLRQASQQAIELQLAREANSKTF